MRNQNAIYDADKADCVDQKVCEAQVELLYRQSRLGLLGVLTVAAVGCVIFWHIIPQWKLAIWIITTALLTIARAISILAFQKRASFKLNITHWAILHVVGVSLSGVLWAVPSISMWPSENSVYQLAWPILVLPLAAAAVATYYTWTLSYTSFIILSVLPVSIRFFTTGGFLFTLLGFLALFFIAVLLRAGQVMHGASINSVTLGIRNEMLNSYLREGIAAREQLNTQLQQEISERKLSAQKLNLKNKDLIILNEELTATKSNLESSNRELEEAIANIKQLSGMLPICASCKKIRNDKGYWEKLESYFRDHSKVIFSHGLCPDCAVNLYPEIYNKKE